MKDNNERATATAKTTAEISKEQLEEWAQVIYENCGEGDNFNNSLYSVVMEMRDLIRGSRKA